MKIVLFALVTLLSTTGLARTQYKMCRLKLEKVTHSQSKNKSYRLGKKTSGRHGNSVQSETETSSLTMIQGRSSSMKIDDSTVFFKCHVSGNKQYDIDVTLNAKNSGISTSVYVTHGQRVDIGRVIKNLKNKNRSIDTKDGASFSRTDGYKVIEYYLMTN